MKARIKSTGEIVDVISYGGDTFRSEDDYVSYTDSSGIEHYSVPGLNYYLDFEELGDAGISTDREQLAYRQSPTGTNGNVQPLSNTLCSEMGGV